MTLEDARRQVRCSREALAISRKTYASIDRVLAPGGSAYILGYQAYEYHKAKWAATVKQNEIDFLDALDVLWGVQHREEALRAKHIRAIAMRGYPWDDFDMAMELRINELYQVSKVDGDRIVLTRRPSKK